MSDDSETSKTCFPYHVPQKLLSGILKSAFFDFSTHPIGQSRSEILCLAWSDQSWILKKVDTPPTTQTFYIVLLLASFRLKNRRVQNAVFTSLIVCESLNNIYLAF